MTEVDETARVIDWRVARSLEVLLRQLDTARPGRSKASDGSIGDASHVNRDSDHNPWYGPGIVTARDFTHDPGHGVDIAQMADQLVATRDRRIKYVIANRRIISSIVSPWVWRAYSGSNPHRTHLHLSVVASPLCDDEAPWGLPMFGSAPPPAPVLLRPGSSGPAVADLQRRLNAVIGAGLVVDGLYGPATERAVRAFQRSAGLAVDGIAGPLTQAALSARAA